MLHPESNPIIITILACTGISCINLFYINKVNSKTVAAFISTVITITMLILFIYVITKKAMIQGFGEEEVDELSIFSLYLGVDFFKIGASFIIISILYAVTYIAISINFSMH